MSDDALIEAMARAMLPDNRVVGPYLHAQVKAALAVARPIIERETRERLAQMFEALPDMSLNAPDIGYIIRNMAALKETGDE